jgi:hypothetical protein
VPGEIFGEDIKKFEAIDQSMESRDDRFAGPPPHIPHCDAMIRRYSNLNYSHGARIYYSYSELRFLVPFNDFWISFKALVISMSKDAGTVLGSSWINRTSVNQL